MDCLKPLQDNSLIRIFHAAPEVPAVDIYFDGKLSVKDISYMQFSRYINVPKGVHSIHMYVAGDDTNPILYQDIKTPADAIFTMAITGNLDNISFESLEEKAEVGPSRDNTYLRLIHLAPNTPSLNVKSNGDDFVDNLSFREFTDYIPLPFGDYRLRFEDSKTNQMVLGVQTTLNSEKIYSIYIIGDSTDSLSAVQSVDANTYMCR